MSNLGYLRGIDGRLFQHLLYAHRHFYCHIDIQKRSLQQLIGIIDNEAPDICCFVEIDKGSSTSAGFNQLESLVSETYPFFDIENKYAQDSKLRLLERSKGKSNGFISKHDYYFEKIYFDAGIKRLIYKIRIANYVTLFFAHFSLKREVRAQQLRHIKMLIEQTPGECIFLGDFNILTGFKELEPLLNSSGLRLLNDKHHHTFRFHHFQTVLDLCICSPQLAERTRLRVIPQPFSDHAALLVEIEGL